MTSDGATIDVRDELDVARARARQAEDRLRSQTMLLAEAEHRLKNALAIISGWASTLDDRWELLDDRRRREGIAIVRRVSEALSVESRRLLEDARAELLALDPQGVVVDLCAILEITTADFQGMAADHPVEHWVGEPAVAAVADPASLQQVLGHLVQNAMAYSPSGCRIVVSARRDGDEAVLEVTDAGLGVPDDVDVFAPFVRGPGTEAVPGVGLGLYLVRNLVRAMGGSVECRRNAEAGSTFTVRLPRALDVASG